MYRMLVVLIAVAAAVWTVDSLAAPVPQPEPVETDCHWGRAGFCVGGVCPEGTMCKGEGKVPYTQGECCIRPACKGGRGVCGGKNNRQCPEGFQCFIAPGSKDNKGKCCRVGGGNEES